MKINRFVCILLALLMVCVISVGCADSDVELSSRSAESSDAALVDKTESSVAESLSDASSEAESSEEESSDVESSDAESSDVESSEVESSEEPISEPSHDESSQESDTVAPVDDIINLCFAPDGFEAAKYESYIDSELEYGSYLVLAPNTEVYDFEYFVLDFDSYFDENLMVIDKVLYTCEKLTSAKPFLTKIYYPGYYGPFCGVSYTDKNGKSYRFVIMESYEDGSYYLSAF